MPRIHEIEISPIDKVPYRVAGMGKTIASALPIVRAMTETLPEPLEALLVASDMQGICEGTDRTRLLGEALAARYLELAAKERVPPPDRVGVLLAGDLYSSPGADEKGASGDVRPVWRAFASAFRWVAGVLGNHDELGSADEERELRETPGVHLLDGSMVVLDGLRIGGVSGVIGNPHRPRRRKESAYLGELRAVLAREPQVLVLHEGPSGDDRQPGRECIRDAIVRARVPLCVSGHVHWQYPLARYEETDALNADGRALLIVRGA